jgi:hypothetical protein
MGVEEVRKGGVLEHTIWFGIESFGTGINTIEKRYVTIIV